MYNYCGTKHSSYLSFSFYYVLNKERKNKSIDENQKHLQFVLLNCFFFCFFSEKWVSHVTNFKLQVFFFILFLQFTNFKTYRVTIQETCAQILVYMYYGINCKMQRSRISRICHSYNIRVSPQFIYRSFLFHFEQFRAHDHNFYQL